MNEPPSVDPKAATISRYMVEEALTSDHLLKAIEAALYRRRSYRWGQLMADAADIRQEVAIRALDRLATFDHNATLALPWLMGIAVNVMRERARHPWGERPGAVGQSSCSEEQWNDILDRLRVQPPHAEEPSPVWEALERLEPDERRVIRLRILEERSYAAIAQAFGITEVAARARLCRALQSLRRKYTPETTL